MADDERKKSQLRQLLTSGNYLVSVSNEDLVFLYEVNKIFQLNDISIVNFSLIISDLVTQLLNQIHIDFIHFTRICIFPHESGSGKSRKYVDEKHKKYKTHANNAKIIGSGSAFLKNWYRVRVFLRGQFRSKKIIACFHL